MATLQTTPEAARRHPMTRTKTLAAAGALALGATLLAGCSSQTAADVAEYNSEVAAENFEQPVRIVGINGITDEILFSVEGYCSYTHTGAVLKVTCLEDRETGETTRTVLGLSDNVTFVRTQMEATETDLFRSRVIFRPETIIPDFDLSTSGGDL
jgi:hypothetical protein